MDCLLQKYGFIGIFIDIGVSINRNQNPIAIVIVNHIAIDSISIPISIKRFPGPTISIIVNIANTLQLRAIPFRGVLINQSVSIIIRNPLGEIRSSGHGIDIEK